jgi:hypothetical protein
MPETFEITGAKELQVLAGDLAKVPAAARAQLRARMRAVGQPMKTAVQRNALAIPASGETSTGLRHAIAAATKVRTIITPETVSVKVYVDPSAMPPGQEKLPALMESRGWTHEVFGRKDTVFQRGHEYFGPAVVPFLPLMRDAVDTAIAEATRTI